MSEFIVEPKENITVKLLHYFVTEENYSPIALQGATDEIWLENMDNDYKIVRISNKYIRNDEQLNRDLFITSRIVRAIKKKALMLEVRTLNIMINVDGEIEIPNAKSISSVVIGDVNDLKKENLLTKTFPNIIKKIKNSEVNIQEFAKITNEINEKNKIHFEETSAMLSPKRPIITWVLIGLNIIYFLLMSLLGRGSEDGETLILFGANVAQFVQAGEYYRLLTAGFIHIGLLHLAVNMYSLYILGSQIESYFGKAKYLIIYLFSIVCGNLLSILFTDGISAGASGAIFGLLGAFAYFGYYFRPYIGNSVIRQIIPLILINLMLGFMVGGIDNAAHIGGLIGGFLITMVLGLKIRKKNNTRIHGIIMTIVYVAFLLYLGFK